MECPKCKSQAAHRSRTRSPWERWRKEITGKRPYRCPDCGWRGWAPDEGPTFSEIERELAERALAPEAPNLAGTALARDNQPVRDIDLDALDSARDTDADEAVARLVARG